MKTEDVVRLAIQEGATASYVVELARALNGVTLEKKSELKFQPAEAIDGFFPKDWRAKAEEFVRAHPKVKVDDIRLALQNGRRMGGERAASACALLESHFGALPGYLVQGGWVYSPLALTKG